MNAAMEEDNLGNALLFFVSSVSRSLGLVNTRSYPFDYPEKSNTSFSYVFPTFGVTYQNIAASKYP